MVTTKNVKDGEVVFTFGSCWHTAKPDVRLVCQKLVCCGVSGSVAFGSWLFPGLCQFCFDFLRIGFRSRMFGGRRQVPTTVSRQHYNVFWREDFVRPSLGHVPVLVGMLRLHIWQNHSNLTCFQACLGVGAPVAGWRRGAGPVATLVHNRRQRFGAHGRHSAEFRQQRRAQQPRHSEQACRIKLQVNL